MYSRGTQVRRQGKSFTLTRKTFVSYVTKAHSRNIQDLAARRIQSIAKTASTLTAAFLFSGPTAKGLA